MNNRSYFTTDGNYGQVGIDDFAILNTEEFTEDDWLAIEEASDMTRLATALAIHARIWDEDDRPRTNWDNIDNLIEQLRDYTYEQDDIELHALYTDIAEAMGY
jgi:hypothetical protein